LAEHLTRRPDSAVFGRPQLVSGVLPGTELGARHYWLQFDETTVDLTADAFGEAPVVVGSRTAFHSSLTSPIAEDASDVFAWLNADETARLVRQLAAIESRLSTFGSPAA
jgi:hypothetical protein